MKKSGAGGAGAAREQCVSLMYPAMSLSAQICMIRCSALVIRSLHRTLIDELQSLRLVLGASVVTKLLAVARSAPFTLPPPGRPSHQPKRCDGMRIDHKNQTEAPTPLARINRIRNYLFLVPRMCFDFGALPLTIANCHKEMLERYAESHFDS